MRAVLLAVLSVVTGLGNASCEAPVQVASVVRPTELLIFGNAKAGTPLMQVNQAIGLVWHDAAGSSSVQCWLRPVGGAILATGIGCVERSQQALT